MEILYGVHPVEEALRSGSRKFDHVCVAKERDDRHDRHNPRLQRVIDACRENGIGFVPYTCQGTGIVTRLRDTNLYEENRQPQTVRGNLRILPEPP